MFYYCCALIFGVHGRRRGVRANARHFLAQGRNYNLEAACIYALCPGCSPGFRGLANGSSLSWFSWLLWAQSFLKDQLVITGGIEVWDLANQLVAVRTVKSFRLLISRLRGRLDKSQPALGLLDLCFGRG